MRIGIFGNLANNGYVLSGILRRHGFDAELVLSKHDNFAMSQPIWEDCDFTLDPQMLWAERAFWLRKGEELGWRQPEWVKEATGSWLQAGLSRPLATFRAALNAGRSLEALKVAAKSMPIIRLLSEYDLIAVYGWGPIYASLTGKPFLAIPYGADVTFSPFQTDLFGRMQKKSYGKARRILVGDPDFIKSLQKLGLSHRYTYFPFPVDVEKYAPKSSEGNIEDKTVFFMPTRQDFRGKGTDIALRAFLKLSKERDDVTLITPTWGEDSDRAKQIVRNSKNVVFLPYAVSKPRLIKLYNSADVVLDQFTRGSYGGIFFEAMACGKAVIVHIDAEKYRPYLQYLPPNLQASSEQHIYEKMKWAANNPDDVKSIGRMAREWAVKQHHNVPVEILKEICVSVSG